MVDSLASAKVDLSASAARVKSAREFARFRARIVEDAVGDADDLNVDLMFLAEESVLVLEDTHQLLQALAAQDAGRKLLAQKQALAPLVPPQKTRALQLAIALQIAVAALIAAFLLEAVDPAPVALQAADVHLVNQ